MDNPNMDDLPWDDIWPHSRPSEEERPDVDVEAHLRRMPTEEELDEHDEDTARHVSKVAGKMGWLCGWMHHPVEEAEEDLPGPRRMASVLQLLLEERAESHDDSKQRWPERPIFARINARLSGLTYGSEAYQEALEFLGPALRHHYAANPHHPEFFEDGIFGMTLLDLGEMACDWAAAIERHEDGRPLQSMNKNRERFEIPGGMAIILTNTLFWLSGTTFSTQAHREATVLGLFWEFILGQRPEQMFVRRSPIGKGDPAVERVLSNTRQAFSSSDLWERP